MNIYIYIFTTGPFVPALTNGPHVSYATWVTHMQLPTYSPIHYRSGFPLERGSSGPPCPGSGPSGRGEVDRPPCPGSGSPSLAGETLVSPWRASSVLSATSTMLPASADAARYRNNGSPGSGATN